MSPERKAMNDNPPDPPVPPAPGFVPGEGAPEFSAAWKRFVQGLRRLLSGVPDDRSLVPFMPLRDTVLDTSERADIVT
jgi:hypothetical protein